MDHDFEDALLASPSHGCSKQQSSSSASSQGKAPSDGTGNELKIVIKRVVDDVDADFFEKLLLELSKMQCLVPAHETQPCFKGSGHSLGVGWFHAADSNSLVWLNHSLKIIQESGTVPDFTVSAFIPIPHLRRAIVNVPNIPRLGKDGASVVLQTISRLNRNLNTKFWKVIKILPLTNGKYSVIIGIDEKSVNQIEKQSCKIYYSLSQVYVKVYSKNE